MAFLMLLIFGTALYPWIYRLWTGQMESLDEITSSAGYAIPMGIMVILILILCFLLIGAFQLSGSVGISLQAKVENRVKIRTFFEKGFDHFWKMSLSLMVMVPFYLLCMVLFILGFAILHNDAGLSLLIGFLSLLLVCTGLLAFMNAPWILVHEKTGAFEAVKKSVRLFFRHFGYVFLTGLVYVVTIIALALVPLLLGTAFFLPILPQLDPYSFSDVQSLSPWMNLFDIVLNLVYAPFIWMVTQLWITHRYLRLVNGVGTPAHPENAEPPSFQIRNESGDSTPSAD